MAADDFAIIVGIDDYGSATFPQLEGAIADAKAFAAWVKDSHGGNVPAANVDPYTLLSVADHSRPLLSHVKLSMAQVLQRRPPGQHRAGRRLYLFLAGHGVSGDDADEACLVTVESNDALIESLPGRGSANLFFKGAAFDEIVLLMDCCRSIVPNLEAAVPGLILRKHQNAHQVRRFYAFATGFGRTAREAAKVGQQVRGVFTSELITGLTGGAADAQGEITTMRLKEWLLRPDGPLGAQKPKFPSSDDDFVICAAPKVDIAITVTLAAPAEQLLVFSGSDLMVPLPLGVLPGAGAKPLMLPRDSIFFLRALNAQGVQVGQRILDTRTQTDAHL